jgi:hypothetical protein
VLQTDADPTTGLLTLNPDGSFSFDPFPDFVGIASFTYVANDGELDSNVATVSINVTEPPQPGDLDLDIAKFNVTKKVKLKNPGTPRRVKIKLKVINAGTVDGEALAMVVGVQEGVEVYAESMLVSSDPGLEANFEFPSYVPVMPGQIVWTVTVMDDNPDVDEATAMTNVEPARGRQPKSKKGR